jgi:hypothetical protein
MFGGDDSLEDSSDPYAAVDIASSLRAQKSSARERRASEAKIGRDKELAAKRAELEKKKAMSKEDRIAALLNQSKPAAAPSPVEKRRGSVFEDYANDLKGLLEGGDDSLANTLGDTMGDTAKTAAALNDSLGNTGIVRYGSVEGKLGALNTSAGAGSANNSMDRSGMDSFDDFMEEMDSDEERTMANRKKEEEDTRKRLESIAADAEREAAERERKAAEREERERERIEEIKRKDKREREERLRREAEEEKREQDAREARARMEQDRVTPNQSLRNSVDTNASTPPPPPRSEPESADRSSIDETRSSIDRSRLSDESKDDRVRESRNSATSYGSSAPPDYSDVRMSEQSNAANAINRSGGSANINKKHEMLRESVDANLYEKESSDSYMKYSGSAIPTGAAAVSGGSRSNLPTDSLLGAAALELEKERARLTEQRVRLQNREMELSRAREVFEGDVRESLTGKKAIGKAVVDETYVRGLEEEKSSLLREVDTLRSEMYELRKQNEAKSAGGANPNSSGVIASHLLQSGDTITISRKELETFKKQIADSEVLINGFQAENDKLVAELKTKTEKWEREKGGLLKDMEGVNVKANRLENRSVSLVQGGFDAIRESFSRDFDAEGVRNEMLRARDEAKAAEARAVEMKFELDKLRKEKKDSELAGQGLSEEVMKRGEADITMLKELIKHERGMHSSEMERLNAKLKWYIQNQELVDRDAAILADQNVLIAKLKAQIDRSGAQMDGALVASGMNQENNQNGGGGVGKKERDRFVKKIKDLEAQVKALEEDIKRRHPDSISNLIRAIGPSESVEVNRKQRNVENERLKKEVEEVRNESEVRMRALRQDYEKMKLGLEGQLKSLKNEVARNKKESSSGGGSNYVKASTAAISSGGESADSETIERLRAYYTKKIADIEKKAESALRQAKRGSNVEQASSASRGNGDRNVTYERVQELEQMISKQKDMIAMMEKSSATRSSQDHKRERDVESKLGIMEGRCKMAEKEVERLKIELSAAEARLEVTAKLSHEQSKVVAERMVLEASRQSLNASLDASHSSVNLNESAQLHHSHGMHPQPPPPPPPMNNALHDAELKQMKVEMEVKKREYEHKINDLQKQVLEAQTTINNFQQQNFLTTQQIMSDNNEQKQELMQQQQRLELAAQTAQMKSAMMQNQLDALKGENLDLSKRLSAVNNNGTISKFGDISARINELERRASDRQDELQEIIKNTREQGKAESRRLQVLHQEEMGEKDKQIRGFKRELDDMLGILKKLTGLKGQ